MISRKKYIKLKKPSRIKRILGITDVKKKEWATFFMIGAGIIILGSSILFDFFVFQKSNIHAGFAIAGSLICILALALRIISAVTLGKYFSIHAEIAEDHTLIKNGPFRFMRHPMYTSTLMLGIGSSIFFRSWIGLIAFFMAYLPAILCRIKVEEKMLIGKLGKEYLKYKRNTKALIPKII